jgi:hypothetical protein
MEPMSKVQLLLDTNEVLSSLAKLQPDELDNFVEKVLSLKASRRASSLSSDETLLLHQINTGLASEEYQKLEVLNQKLHDEALTATEHEQLMILTEKLEQRDAERMKAVVELATVRGVSLGDVMKQIGLPSKPHG